MKRSVLTVLVVPKTLHREGLARLLFDTDYKPVRSLTRIDEFTLAPEPEGEQLLFIISSDACARTVGHDASLPELQELRRQYPDAKLLVLSDVFDVDDAVAALCSGANGYIMNTLSSEALIRSLDLVMIGETVLASEFSRAVCERSRKVADARPRLEAPGPACASEGITFPHDSDRNGDAPKLSTRETAILSRLMQGDSNKNIARGIGVAEATVKTHIKAILRKIRVRNRTQAALWAFNYLERPVEASANGSLSNGVVKDA